MLGLKREDYLKVSALQCATQFVAMRPLYSKSDIKPFAEMLYEEFLKPEEEENLSSDR
jgi:hypothetical protein